MNGGESDTNIAQLTAEEHYLAHALLVKMYKNTEHYSKLICAFRYMSVHDTKNRINNKDYGWMRREFSKHHPMKNPELSKQVGEKVSQAWKAGKFDHLIIERVECECACGCGDIFIKKINSNQIFILGHYSKHEADNNPIEYSKRQSDGLSNYIKSLTDDENCERVKRSLGSCDHKKRGDAISKGKKGKKTNQKRIEIVRYGVMSECEFDEYIKGRKPFIQTRMRNRRADYISGNY